MGGCGFCSFDSGYGPVTGCCDHSNELVIYTRRNMLECLFTSHAYSHRMREQLSDCSILLHITYYSTH
jgi:hypothetical protein